MSAVDAIIAAQQAEVDAWEQRKKGVMQKLFSQEVKFKADDGTLEVYPMTESDLRKEEDIGRSSTSTHAEVPMNLPMMHSSKYTSRHNGSATPRA